MNFVNIIFVVLFLCFFCILIFKLHFVFIPGAIFVSSFIIYLFFKQEKWIKVSLFLTPILSALAYFSPINYPYNYFLLPLIFWGGGILIELFSKEKILGKFPKPLRYFIYALFISSVFVYARWTNITLKGMAFLENTPVSPAGERFSFAVIFPLMSMLIFTSFAYIFAIFRSFKEDENHEYSFYKAISYGYFISVLFALLQKLNITKAFACGNCLRIKQFNGMFSDFNALGTFSGILFFITVYMIIKKFRIFPFLTMFVSVFGSFISGSRSSFFLIVIAVAYFFFSMVVMKKNFISGSMIIIVFVFLFLVFGGSVKNRVLLSFKSLGDKGVSIKEKLDRFTNRRVTMLNFGIETVKEFPISGVGIGNYLFYLRYKNYGKDYLYDLPLNQYLLVLEETGVVGLLFFIYLLVYIYLGARKKLLFLSILFIFLFNTALWLPEIVVIFGFLSGMGFDEKKIKINEVVILLLLVVFVIFNILTFNELHPANWLKEKGKYYDYGFWYNEESSLGVYRWTKGKAGIYINSDELRKKFTNLKIFCGAPLNYLPKKIQKVKVYWKGKLYKEIIFTRNSFVNVLIDFNDENGFLELRINPVFNLKKMNLGVEPRTLGIQVYGFKKFLSLKEKKNEEN